MSIAQLQVLTEYSLLSSTNRIEDLVITAKQRGYDSLAITDKNTLHGVIEFYQTCLKHQVKPIIGMTLTYQVMSDIEADLILLAKNLSGYEQLMKIATLKGEFATHQNLELKDISSMLSDLILVMPFKTGEAYQLRELNKDDRITRLNEFKEITKQCDTFAGISIQGNGDEDITKWVDFYKEVGLPIIALDNIKYLNPSDDFSVRVLEHIEDGKVISVDFTHTSGPYYLEEANLFCDKYQQKGLDEALRHVRDVVDSIELIIPLNQTLLPKFERTEGLSSYEFLKKTCQEGLMTRLGTDKTDVKTYQDRLDYELSVIHEMGFDDYFLIVWDVMRYAREKHIVTACRGSAAGSLVAFVLQITDVDPIEYHLLFERFLNKERYTMPDIDMDIPDNKREEVLEYVHQTYGHHRVAQIATFGTLAAKMSLRDVSRVFGLSQNEASKWADAVPNTLKITLEQAYHESKKLRDLVAFSEKNRLLFETAKKIEGLPRHVSTHAAGVVISDRDLTELIPLQEGNNGIALTQFAMGDVEAIGLLKMDFLGLRNLAIIGNTIDDIFYQTKERIDLETIPIDDEKTLELFRKGQTIGIFQFESSGIKNVLRKLGPTSIEDLASVNALYRPGPMENIDLFIQRKKGIKPIHYPHPDLKPILDYTYGIIVYQEQVMQIASLMAGFTLGQADILRRAISKKSKDVIDQEREHFVQGAMGKGYTQQVAEEVYDYIEKFANYGFNRSHAVVYSVIAYQMAYLKVHYSTAFFQSLLHSVKNNQKKINEYISEARDFNVGINPPDINKSDYSFTFYKGNILYGFSSLKGIRKDFIQHIIHVRKTDGPYTSLENFLLRINGKWLKEANILPLIYIGAFDGLHQNRKQLVVDLDGMIQNIEYSGGSIDLLDVLTLKKHTVPDFTNSEKLEQEQLYLGTYVSSHPVNSFDHLIKRCQVTPIKQLEIGKTYHILFYVTKIKKIRTKKGESMAFLEGSDETDTLSVTIFPITYRQIGATLSENQVLLITGKVEKSKYNQETQLIADKVILAEDIKLPELLDRRCFINIKEDKDNANVMEELFKIFQKYSGSTPVILIFRHKEENRLLEDRHFVTESKLFVEEIQRLLGETTVIFK